MFNQKKIKINFYSAKTKKADIALKTLKKKYINYPVNEADIIVALGGDGTILSALHKSIKFSKPIFGINRGEYGFLTNPYKKVNLIKRLEKAKKTEIHVLKMIATKKDGKKKEAVAFNEVSLLRNSRHAAKIKVKVDDVVRIKELVCDGILLATPAGSTAYNLSVHGPILSLDSKKLSISPISPFRPRRWKGKVVGDKTTIIIKNLNSKKRPISAVADNYEVRNAKTISIKKNKKLKFNLLYDSNRSLQKKIKIEQIRKETS